MCDGQGPACVVRPHPGGHLPDIQRRGRFGDSEPIPASVSARLVRPPGGPAVLRGAAGPAGERRFSPPGDRRRVP